MQIFKKFTAIMAVLCMLMALMPANMLPVSAATYSISTGNASRILGDATKFYYPSATVTADSNVMSLAIEATSATIVQSTPSGGSSSFNLTSNYAAYSFGASGATAATVQAFLRTVQFTGNVGASIKFSISGNSTSLPTNAKVTQGTGTNLGHYYMYVPQYVSWTNAYNLSKTYYYQGMRGYLATMTSLAERQLLNSINAASAWIAGTSLQTAASGGSKINDQTSINADNYTVTTALINATTPQARSDLMYWACGPEAGHSIGTYSSVPWVTNEPSGSPVTGSETVVMNSNKPRNTKESCIAANYQGTSYNDICEGNWAASAAQTSAGAYGTAGFFVEFSNYPGGLVGGYDAAKTATATHEVSAFQDYTKVYVHATKTTSGDGDGTFATPFKTLQLAYNAVQSGGEIRVLSDLTVTAATEFNSAKAFTLQSYSGENTVATTPWTVKANMNLASHSHILYVKSGTLNLKTIKLDGSNQAGCLRVGDGTSGSITANATMVNGVTITGGKTANNFVGGGAGIRIDQGGKVTMSGGSITNNNNDDQDGGGVTIITSTANTANLAQFEMSGGSITNNRSGFNGAGVSSNNGTFTMTGGSITNNSTNVTTKYAGGGGVCMLNSGIFTIGSGSLINISGNKSIAGGEEICNVYLGEGQYIRMSSAPTSGSTIGVYAVNMPNSTQKVRTIATGATAVSAQSFSSDKATAAGIKFTASAIGSGTTGQLGYTPANSIYLDYDTGSANMRTVTITAGTGMTVSGSPQTVTAGAAISSISVTAQTGYILPATYAIGNGLTFTRNTNTTGTITGTPTANVTHTITAASLATYNVTHTLGNITATANTAGAGKASHNTAYTTTLTAAANYTLPTAITVTVGGVAQTVGSHYTYNSTNGAVSINANRVTGDIVITATAVYNGPIYVHATTGTPPSGSVVGNDSTGDGSFAKPVATLTKAYSLVPSGGEIRVLSDLSSTSNISAFDNNKMVTIVSYSDKDTVKIANPYTIMRSTIDNAAFMTVSNGSNITFKHIILDGGNKQDSKGSYFYNQGTLTFDDGAILQNQNVVSVGTVGAIHMASGVLNVKGNAIIRNNCVTHDGKGGGVYAESGTINISGTAQITGNTASDNGGGLYVVNGIINLSGSPKITGNKNSTTGQENNIYLATGKTLTINGRLAGGANIGVNLQTMPGSPGDKVNIATGAVAGEEVYFKSDKATDAGIILEGSVVKLSYDDRISGNHKLQNGSFETPVGAGTFYPKNGESGLFWRTTATDNQIELSRNPSSYNLTKAAEGSQFAELNATQVSTLYQTIAIDAADFADGAEESGSFYLKLAHAGRQGTDVMDVTIGLASDFDGITGTFSGDNVFTMRCQSNNYKWTYYNSQVKIAVNSAPGVDIVLGGTGKMDLVFAFKSVSSSGENQGIGNLLDDINFFEINKYPDEYKKLNSVAKIGTVEYSTLQQAIDAAIEGDVITIIADVSDETVTVNKSITIDGGIPQDDAGSFAPSSITVNADVDVTLKNMDFADDATANILLSNSGKVVFADETVAYAHVDVNSAGSMIKVDGTSSPHVKITTGETSDLGQTIVSSTSATPPDASKFEVDGKGDGMVADSTYLQLGKKVVITFPGTENPNYPGDPVNPNLTSPQDWEFIATGNNTFGDQLPSTATDEAWYDNDSGKYINANTKIPTTDTLDMDISLEEVPFPIVINIDGEDYYFETLAFGAEAYKETGAGSGVYETIPNGSSGTKTLADILGTPGGMPIEVDFELLNDVTLTDTFEIPGGFDVTLTSKDNSGFTMIHSTGNFDPMIKVESGAMLIIGDQIFPGNPTDPTIPPYSNPTTTNGVHINGGGNVKVVIENNGELTLNDGSITTGYTGTPIEGVIPVAVEQNNPADESLNIDGANFLIPDPIDLDKDTTMNLISKPTDGNLLIITLPTDDTGVMAVTGANGYGAVKITNPGITLVKTDDNAFLTADLETATSADIAVIRYSYDILTATNPDGYSYGHTTFEAAVTDHTKFGTCDVTQKLPSDAVLYIVSDIKIGANTPIPADFNGDKIFAKIYTANRIVSGLYSTDVTVENIGTAQKHITIEGCPLVFATAENGDAKLDYTKALNDYKDKYTSYANLTSEQLAAMDKAIANAIQEAGALAVTGTETYGQLVNILNKAVKVINANGLAGIDNKTGDGYIVINPSDNTKQYVLADKDGNVVDTKQGDGNQVEFDRLLPGQEYNVVVIDESEEAPTTPVDFGSYDEVIPVPIPSVDSNVSADKDAGNDEKIKIVVSPASADVKYAVVQVGDTNDGQVVGGDGGWKTADNGQVVFDHLDPNTEYRIVTVPKTVDKPPIENWNAGDKADDGTTITTPDKDAGAVAPGNIGRDGDKITIDGLDPDKEYAIRDPETGNMVGSWKSGDNKPAGDAENGVLTFDDLDPSKEYEIVSRTPEDGSKAPSIPTPGISVMPNIPESGISGGMEKDGQVFIKIDNADPNLEYGLVKIDSQGNTKEADWSPPTGDETEGYTVTFPDLDPDAEYKVVTRPKDSATPATPTDAAGGTTVIAPPGKVATKDIDRIDAGNGTDTISFPTEEGHDYFIVDSNGYPVVGPIEGKGPSGTIDNVTIGDNGHVTVTGLNPDQEYYIQVKTPDETGKISVPNQTKVPQIPNATTGIDNGTGDAYITIEPTEHGKTYVLADKNGEVVETMPGNTDGGGIIFQELMPGQEYEIIVIDTPTTPLEKGDDKPDDGTVIDIPAVDGNNITAGVGGDDEYQATITINPASDLVEYALVDKSGNLVGGTPHWKSPESDGTVSFDTLAGEQEYTVVTRPKGDTSTTPVMVDRGTAVVTPKLPVSGLADPHGTTRNLDGDITVGGTNSDKEYAVRNSETGEIITDWKSGDPITFDGLDPHKAYEIVSRDKDVGGNPSLPILPGTPVSPVVDPINITGGTDTDGNPTILIDSDITLDYGLVKDDGTAVGGWTPGTGNPIEFPTLDGQEYRVVTRPKDNGPANPADLGGGTAVVAPPEAVDQTHVNRTDNGDGTDTIAFPTEGGKQYQLVVDGVVVYPNDGGWHTSDGSGVSFNVDSDHKVEIIVRNPEEIGKISVTNTTVVNPLIGTESGIDNQTGDAYIVISPAKDDKEYVLMDGNGNVVAVKDGAESVDDAVIFEGILPGQGYEVVAVGKTNVDEKTPSGGKISVAPTESGAIYVLIDQDTGEVVAQETGDGAPIDFSDLEDGKKYDVITINPGTPSVMVAVPAVDDNSITAGIDSQNPEKTTITINPASDLVEYALTDGTNVKTDWKTGEEGKVAFDNLDPGVEYTVVTVPKGDQAAKTNPSGGTTVVTPDPDNAVTPEPSSIIRQPDENHISKDKIVIGDTETGTEYAVRNPETGEISGWQQGTGDNGAALVFDNLEKEVTYEVVTRNSDENNTGKPGLPITPGVAVGPNVDTSKITGGTDSDDKPCITINNPNPDLDYGLVDSEGTAVGTPVWQPGDGPVVFEGLEDGKEYTVVTRPKDNGPANPSEVGGGTSVIAPPQAVTDVVREDSATDGKDKITFPSDATKEYQVVDGSGTVVYPPSGWQAGTGNPIVVDDLDPDTDYQVLVRVPETGGKTSVPNVTDVPSANYDITGGITSDGKATITIDPTVTGKKYAIVDETGNVIGDWVSGADGQAKTITGLEPGKEYRLVVIDQDKTPTEQELKKGKTVVAPIAPIAPDSIKTGNGTITIMPTNENQSYAVVDPDTGKVVDTWKDGTGTGGEAVVFEGLKPGKEYEVVTIPKGKEPKEVVYLPGTDAVTKFGDVTGGISDGKATITVSPSDTGTKYAVVDKDGNVVGGDSGWKNGAGDGELVFTGLTPGEQYKVISVSGGTTNPPTSGQNDTPGVGILAPVVAVNPDNVTTGAGTVIINPTVPNQEYAVVGPDGKVVAGEWKSNPNGGVVTFRDLDPAVSYTVVNRVKTDETATKPTTPGVPTAPGFTTITGKNDGTTSAITVGPTKADNPATPVDEGMQYAVVDQSGNVIGGWKDGNGGAITFDGLTPGEDYKVISKPKTETPSDSGHGATPGVDVTAPIARVSSDKIEKTETSVTVGDTDPNLQYAVIDPVTGKEVSVTWKDGTGKEVTGTWQNGNGGTLTFAPLVSGKEYNIVVKEKSTGISIPSTPGTAVITNPPAKTYTAKIGTETYTGAPGTTIIVPTYADGGSPTQPTSMSDPVFVGWSDGTRTYKPGDVYTLPNKEVILTPVWQPTYSIDGAVVYDNNGNKVDGANVVLTRGNQQVETGTTAADGKFTFTGVEPGLYNVVVEKDGVIVTQLVEITDKNQTGIEIRLPDGKKNSVVKVVGETPSIVVGALNEQFEKVSGNDTFTDNDEKIVTNGGTVELKFIAEQKAETVVATDAVKIREKLEPARKLSMGMFLDFKVEKKVTEDGSTESKVTNITKTPNLLKILVPLPLSQQGMGDYQVYRVHDGTAEIMNQIKPPVPTTVADEGFVLNHVDGKVVSITIYAKSFSTYAVAFSACAINQVVSPSDAAISGTSISKTVDNETVSQVIDVEISQGATWALYSDSACTNEITDKTMSLNVGANTAYIKVTAADGTEQIYTITITRQTSGSTGGGSTGSGTGGGTGGSSTGGFYVGVASGLNVSSAVIGGRISASPEAPKSGETVTITVMPDSGYALDTLTITNAAGTTVDYTDNGDGTYSFTMGTVGTHNVNATFKYVADPENNGVSEKLNTDQHMAYLVGYEDGNFGPQNNMTRAEVAMMLYRLLGNKDAERNGTFTDVPEDEWYTEAVYVLSASGIINGYPEGDFRPTASITRAEFVAMTTRFANETAGTRSFSDVTEADWFVGAINTATGYGWLNGYPDGTFLPQNNITRAEATKVMNAVLGRRADKAYIDSAEGLKTFSDVTKDLWSYYEIMEATNAHEFDKTETGENWR